MDPSILSGLKLLNGQRSKFSFLSLMSWNLITLPLRHKISVYFVVMHRYYLTELKAF